MNISEILELLETERRELSSVENFTEQILYAPADDFIGLIAERGEYLTNAVLAENRLKEIAAQSEKLLAVLNGGADLESLDDEQRQVFEASLRVKSILCRIKRLEPRVVTRMENERAEALSHIEELNSSSNSVVASYSRALHTAVPRTSLMGSGVTV